MNKVRIIENEGIYTLEGFDVEINEWKKMLQDTNVFDDKSLTMIKQWYYEEGHYSSSKIMTAKYHPSLANTPYNGIVVGLGKRLLKYLKRFEIEKEDDSDCFWVTVFDGWYENNCFIWKLRDDICKALEELNYVGDSAIERPRFWVFPCDSKYYNVYGAFERYDQLYWRQHLKNIKVGDKVFIYVGKPESKLSFYCEVLEVDKTMEQASIIDDSDFYISTDEESNHEYKYTRLKLLKRIYDDRFNLKQLNRFGIKGNIQGQQELKSGALEFVLDMINYRYLDIKELEDNIEVFKLAHLEEEQTKFKACEIERQKFIKRFPIDETNKITLKDYCLGLDTNDNFCYFLETRLKASGSIKGGSAQKFGVFYSRDNGRFETLPKWSKSKNEIEALENIKNSIAEVIKAGKDYDLYTLENNKLAIVLKGKILASYYPEQYLGIFGDEDFDHFFYKLGVPFNKRLSPVRKQYQLLKLKQENKVFDSLTFDEFMSFLYTMYGQDLLAKKKEDNKRNFKRNDNGSDEQEENESKPIKKKLIKEDYDFVGNSKVERTIKRKGPVDFESLQKKRTAVGYSGEMLVLEYETELLRKSGSKLRPYHIALADPSAGYDIISYDETGKIKYIEVKTRKAKNTSKLDFFITANEKEKFETLEGYVIYFVSDLNSDTPKLRVVTKEIYEKLELEPIAFHVKADIKVIG